MAVKPFQSTLIPYRDEIADLRSRKPPISYARISEILRQKYGLRIQRAAIAKFVKARSGGRKVYFFRREIAAKKSKSVQPAALPADPASLPPRTAAANKEESPANIEFRFTPSERYNLKRLPPEEAAAIRRKLEEKGH
jgi:hypothetical protein